jgi:putative copper resistance protein D
MMWLTDGVRMVQLVSTLGLFGATTWQLTRPTVAPPFRASPEQRIAYAAVCLLGAAATVGWLLIEAATIAGRWSAVGALIGAARFGQAAALRALLLVISALLSLLMPHRTRALGSVLAVLYAAAIISFVWTGHGSAGAGAVAALHACADALHLFCAAVWIGALLMLSALAAQALAAQTLTKASALLEGLLHFSAIGPALISLLILTGLINTWLLVGPGHWRALVTEPYGQLLVGKVMVFAGMLALGAHHRYRSTPRLRQLLDGVPAGSSSVADLRRTLLAETALALIVLAVVAVLGTLVPPAAALRLVWVQGRLRETPSLYSLPGFRRQGNGDSAWGAETICELRHCNERAYDYRQQSCCCWTGGHGTDP